MVGENAEVTLIDRYGSPALGRALSDAIVEIHAGPGSRVRYVALQEYGHGVTHLAVQRARIGRGADLKSLGVAFGASLARAEVEALLAEDGGSSEMLGVYFGDGEQHIDHRSIQDHVGSRTSSDLLYKGAMRDTSNAIYTGTVIIERGAHQCDAYQTNRNILLSDHARAQSVPNSPWWMSWWHDTHAAAGRSSLNLMETWHERHGACACAPCSRNPNFA